jgi:hypothetical protein
LGGRRRAAAGANLDSRRQPRSEGVRKNRKRVVGVLEYWGAEFHPHHSIPPSLPLK